MKLRNVIFIMLISISTCLGHTAFAASKDEYMKKFQAIFEMIDKYYVQEPDKEKMLEAAINGMASSLDPHSSYFNKEEYADLDDHIKGEFGGIGIEVIFENSVVKVVSPIDDLPADRAGVKPGDSIVAINDELVPNLGYTKAVKNMRGKPGTKVHITVIREGENKPIELDLVREIVKIKSVKYSLDNDIAYIRIAAFNKTTKDELEKAFTALKQEAKNGVKGIIMDVRNNPGGLLDQAVAVTNFFIDEGVIVSTKGRTSTSVSKEKASQFGPKAPKVPVVVLINSGTASAPEIVAGALQDYGRAIIMGTKSFGKGSVQTVAPIGDGALKLTIAKYYTPNGRSIQAEGITPDIIVEPAKIEYLGSQKEERKYSEASLKNHLKNETTKEDQKDNNKDKEPSKALQISELYKKDYQYSRAFDLLKGLIISKSAVKANGSKANF
ncbi:MAG: tail-specific protease [Rickettsiaceae bacterium]|jgi:carboxyl-terminal processing protease|nr:tail-specific protease [Rickettsiaceae bacterium]